MSSTYEFTKCSLRCTVTSTNRVQINHDTFNRELLANVQSIWESHSDVPFRHDYLIGSTVKGLPGPIYIEADFGKTDARQWQRVRSCKFTAEIRLVDVKFLETAEGPKIQLCMAIESIIGDQMSSYLYNHVKAQEPVVVDTDLIGYIRTRAPA